MADECGYARFWFTEHHARGIGAALEIADLLRDGAKSADLDGNRTDLFGKFAVDRRARYGGGAPIVVLVVTRQTGSSPDVRLLRLVHQNRRDARAPS